jgi:hypothetical protein
MKGWFKKIIIPIVARATPFFAAEIFMVFLFLNTLNKIDDIPSLLPLNVGFYR